MKKKFFSTIFFCLFFCFFMAIVHSCKKEEPDTETQSSVDNSICEGEFSRIFPQTHGIAVGDSGVQRMMGIDNPVPFNECPDHYIDPADTSDGFPVTMWLSYGSDTNGDGYYETGCTGNDGKIRQGVVEAVFSAPWPQPGSSITMDLQNYYVNGIKYEGTIVVRKANTSFTQVVTNGKCSKGSVWTILWNSSRTITYLGEATLNPHDDICLIAGSAEGTDRNGKQFSVDIDANNPLKREMGCRYIVKGTQTLKLEGRKDRTIDYGDGTCDDRAKLIIDGNEFEFKLQ